MTGMSRHFCHFPRSRVTPSLVPSRALAAVEPSAQMALGRMVMKLAVKKLAANFHLVGLGRAVFGWAALDDVADVNVGARERDAFLVGGALDHLREQLAGPADERQTLRILVRPRAFPHKHQFRLLVAGSEYELVPSVVQTAAFALTYIFQDFQQDVIGRLQREVLR